MSNKIYYGDNLDILRNYIASDSIDLCYIDPPFNSDRIYNQIYNNVGDEDKALEQAFVDIWTWDDKAIQGFHEIQTGNNKNLTPQSIDLITGLAPVLGKSDLLAYLISMTLRIAEIYRVLKKTGSFYLHCDPTASHYLKLVLDALFYPKKGQYIAEITWERTSAHSDAKCYANTADIIFVYSKSKKITFNQQFKNYSEEYIKKYYKHKDEKGRFLDRDLTAAGLSGGGYEYEWNNVKRIWRCPISTMERYEKENRLYYTRNGTPRLKQYLDEMRGVPITTIWTDIPPINSQAKERLGYDTQKPEKLLERIIKTSSNEGDIILDAFCGCGTSIAVAQKLNRQWIGIDITYRSIALILKRLQDNFGYDFTQNLIDKETQQIIPASVEINGVPKDFDSAKALAEKIDDRTRKEFEKWIILTYTKNRAIVNEGKGGDKGIDGMAYIPDRNEKNQLEHKKVYFSVKSSKTLTPSMLNELNGVIDRDKAACGIFLTLYSAPNLVKASKEFGFYQNRLVNKDYPKIQVVSVDDIFKGNFLDLPNIDINDALLKKAQQHVGKQMNLV